MNDLTQLGVQAITSGSKSSMSSTCFAVLPPDTGTTPSPSRPAPAWVPSPPVNRPYP